MQLSSIRPSIRPSVRLSVRPSVCPIRPLHVADAGLLLWTRLTKDIDRLLHGRRAGRQQQTRRSSVRRLDARAFQFGQKKVLIRFDSILVTESIFFDSIRFANLINLPLLH